MRISFTALAFAVTFATLGSAALADSTTATRQVTMQGITQAHPSFADRNVARREQTYKTYYHHKYGSYPSDKQVHDWYVKTYHKQPA